MSDENHNFYPLDRVDKVTGDYKFTGQIVSVFRKLDGKIRYVVENQDGILHIFSESQLKSTPPKTPDYSGVEPEGLSPHGKGWNQP